MPIIKSSIKRILKYIKRAIETLTKVLDYRVRYLNVHDDFTIISNNCIAGLLYQDFGVEYKSPTIGLQISQNDFVKFCRFFTEYIRKEISLSPTNEQEEFSRLGGGIVDFPVGKLDDITIFFQHEISFKEAQSKWKRRKERVEYDNIFFVFVAYDSTSIETLLDFNSIEFPNKVILTNSKRIDAENAYPLFNRDKAWFNKNRYGKQYYKKFNFLKWIYRESKRIQV